MIDAFDEPRIRAAVDVRTAVDAIRAAFRADGLGQTIVPPVINLQIPADVGEFHIKTAFVEGVPFVAVKVASGFYGNAAKGLTTGSGMMALFDAATGLPSALLMDNGFLTDLRTGAAGAVAADVLARRDAASVAMIGSGVQGRFQLRCLKVVRPIARVMAWSPNRARLERYCAEIAAELGIAAIAASSAEDACRGADIIVTATPSRAPIVRADWLRPGVHVTALGSDSPGKQELEAACLSRADLVVTDRTAQCEAFGELRHAIEAGSIRASDVHAQLGEVVAGKKSGRTSDRQITIADLTGVGFQDTAIAAAVKARLMAG